MKNLYKIRAAVSAVVFFLALLGIAGIFYPVKIFDVQFAPLIQRVFADFSIAAITLLLGLILITLLFGRFYCSVICPFGILQEIAALIFKNNKNKFTPSYPVKYFISAAVFGILAGGSAIALRYIEPYTYFGSSFTFAILGIAASVTVLAIVFFKNRFFCTNICPVGVILGLLSKISLNKIYIDKSNCVSCGMCERNCQSSCINSKEKSIDNETCVKCMKCLGVCPKNAVKYGQKPKEDIKFSIKRRQVIISAAAIALFGGMVKTGMILKDKAVQKIKEIILPPGAGSVEEFSNKCFNCNLCVANCPDKVLVKADKNFPTVHLDYSSNHYCDKNCNKCSQVCPTGAIKRLSSEEKQKTRIGMAMIDKEKCSKCGLCSFSCPYGAITKADGEFPVLDASKCVGCGKCKSQCPSEAINVFAVKKQTKI